MEERIPPITKRSLEQPIAGCSKSEATGVPIGDTNVTPDTGARNKIRVKPKMDVVVEERIPPITKRSLEQPIAGCSKSEATGVPIGDTIVTPDTGARNKIRVKPKDVVVEKGEKKKGPGAAPIVTYRGCDTASCSGTSEYTYYGTTKGELSGMSYISLDLSEDTSLDSGLIELFTSTSSAALEKRRGGRFCVTVDATGLFCRVGEKILGLKCASGPALPDKEAPGELSTCSSRAPAQIFVLPQFPDEMEVFDDGKTVKVGGLDVKGGCIEFSYCVGVRKVTGIGLINIMLLNSDPENFVLLRRYMHLQHSRLYAFLKKKEEKLNRRAMLGNSDRKEYEKRIFAVLPAYLTGCEEGIDFAADLRRHCRGFEMVLARGLLEESSPSCRLLREALRRVRIHDSESTSKKRSDEGRGTDFSVMAGLYVISSSNGRFFGCSQKEKKGKKGKVAAKVVAEFFSNAGFRASLVATAFEMLGKAMLAGHVEDGSEEIASSIPWVCRQIPGLSEGIAFAVKASLDESFSDLYSAFANNTSLVSFLPMSIIPGFLNTRAGVSFSGDPEYVRRMRMHCALSEKLGDDFLLRFVIAGEALRRAKLWGGSELEFCERMITGSLTQVGSIRPLRGKLLDRLNALLPKLGLDELKELVVHALSYEILQFKSLGTEFLFEDLMYGISRDIPNYDALATNYVVTGGGSYSKGESILALLVSEDISGVYCFPLRESVIGMRVGDCTKREKKMDAIKSIDGGGRYCFGVG